MRYVVGSLAVVVVVVVVALTATQGRNVLETHDDGPAPSLDMLDPVSPPAAEEAEARAEKQGNTLARASDGPVRPSEPTQDADAQPWEALPPARVAESSDNCIGYCFDAIVESVDRDDARVARVVVLGEDGARTRAVVERTRTTGQSRSATYYGLAVRFSCFEQVNAVPVPRFEGCAQMARERQGLGASRDGRSQQESDSDVFDLADPL